MSREQDNFKGAIDLIDLALAMVRQKYLRKHPEASEAELDRVEHAWFAAAPLPTQGKEFEARKPPLLRTYPVDEELA